MTYQPEHLKMWNCGGEFASAMDSCSNYAGDRFDDRYVVVTRTRDSDILTEVNFTVALECLGGEQHDEVADKHIVQIVRIGHWACGWIEHLMVHKDAPEALLKEAEEIVCALADYPVLDDDAYSEAQDEAVYSYWEDSMSLKERVEACRQAGVSIFHARPKRGIPEKCYDDIREQCP